MTTVPPDDPKPTEDRLLPWKKVQDLTGLSRTTAWRLQKAGDFPRPVVISPGRVGWRESELAAWKISRTPRAAQRPKPPMAPRISVPEPQPSAPAPTVARPMARVSPARRATRRRPTSATTQMSLNF
jgi:predicted DNA-binding transcriptional regulator AlpA